MKHRQSVILFILLAAFTLCAFTIRDIQFAAMDPDDPKGKHQNYKGVILEVGETSLTLELRDGTSVTIQLTDETNYKMRGKKAVSAADLQAGMQAMVQAVRAGDEGADDGDDDGADNGVLTARRVMVIPSKPERVHRVGIVTAYTPDESITIQAKDEQLYTFLLTTETKILPPNRVNALEIGARVTIIAPRDPGAQELTAKGIVVHPAE